MTIFFIVCPKVVDNLRNVIMDMPYLSFLLKDWLAPLHNSLTKTLFVSLYDSSKEANSLANGEAPCTLYEEFLRDFFCFMFCWVFLRVHVKPQKILIF